MARGRTGMGERRGHGHTCGRETVSHMVRVARATARSGRQAGGRGFSASLPGAGGGGLVCYPPKGVTKGM